VRNVRCTLGGNGSRNPSPHTPAGTLSFAAFWQASTGLDSPSFVSAGPRT